MSDDITALTPDEIRELEGHANNGVLLGGIETRSVAEVDDVKVDQRIITVIAVPYEQPTQVPFQRDVWNEVFSRSAFDGLDVSKRRIPTTACLEIPAPNHQGAKLVGRAVEARSDDPRGLVTDLKISRTSTGDDALELARDGNLSVSVGFMVKNRLDQVLDARSKTRRIARAFLDHIALVGQPAYAGAGVIGTRGEGSDTEIGESRTPALDEFLEDDIFKWAQDRAKR